MENIEEVIKHRQSARYWLLLVFVLCFSLYAFWENHGGDVSYRHGIPGQNLYLFSKLMGLVAIALLWWQILVALLSRVGATARNLLAGRQIHIILGVSLMLFVLLHLGFYIAAAWLRTGEVPWNLLVPAFSEGYYSLMVSLGVLGAGCLLLTLLFGMLLTVYSQMPRFLHYLGIAAFFLVFIHSISIGSETNSGVLQWVYYAMLMSTVIGLVLNYRYRKKVV